MPGGLEDIWIVGDIFVARTMPKFLSMKNKQPSYIKDTFEIHTITGGQRQMNRNVIGRIRNAVATAIGRYNKLPTFIIFAIEDDIISNIIYNDFGLKILYGEILDWLMSEIRMLIQEFKRMIPARAKKAGLPKIIWLGPTIHSAYRNNNKRIKFTDSLASVCHLFPEVSAFKVKKPWLEDNIEYFLGGDKNRWSADGIRSYWYAVDNIIKSQHALLQPTQPQSGTTAGNGTPCRLRFDNQPLRPTGQVRPFGRARFLLPRPK